MSNRSQKLEYAAPRFQARRRAPLLVLAVVASLLLAFANVPRRTWVITSSAGITQHVRVGRPLPWLTRSQPAATVGPREHSWGPTAWEPAGPATYAVDYPHLTIHAFVLVGAAGCLVLWWGRRR